MKVSDQIKVRREQLGVSVSELAKRLKVSGQSVRHWEHGRSYPGKAKIAALESALSFNIDWTEGSRAAGGRSGVSALIDQADIDLLLLICRLPPKAKVLFSDLVKMHVTALDGGRKAFSERATEGSVPAFSQTSSEVSKGLAHATPKQAKKPSQNSKGRRKAA
jgi:transcriptional regulator with XRE-family HTH domain